MSDDLYDRYVKSLTTAAYNAATRPTDEHSIDRQPWHDAQSGSGRAITVAGGLAAHLVRLHAAVTSEHDIEPPLWAWEVARATKAITLTIADRGRDERALVAMAIRRAITRGPAGDPGAEPARMLSTWLFPSGQQVADAAAGQLARHAVDGMHRHQELLAAAWYAVHGLTLVKALAAEQPEAAANGGRPRQETANTRVALRIAVRGVAAADIVEKKAALAEAARVSRPTLDNWLS
ncbi:hypothetical protein ACIOBK_33835 [Micromonospora chokoriensis]